MEDDWGGYPSKVEIIHDLLRSDVHMQALVRAGADVTATTSTGRTVLHDLLDLAPQGLRAIEELLEPIDEDEDEVIPLTIDSELAFLLRTHYRGSDGFTSLSLSNIGTIFPRYELA